MIFAFTCFLCSRLHIQCVEQCWCWKSVTRSPHTLKTTRYVNVQTYLRITKFKNVKSIHKEPLSRRFPIKRKYSSTYFSDQIHAKLKRNKFIHPIIPTKSIQHTNFYVSLCKSVQSHILFQRQSLHALQIYRMLTLGMNARICKVVSKELTRYLLFFQLI